MSVLDTVQETLFQQFLAGSDPSRRLADSSGGSSRVEDLPWWKYQRALALWYCEWLDTYYDSVERCFLWRDELTQGFEAANLEEIKDAAQRMRLALPEHEERRRDDEELIEEVPIEHKACEASEASEAVGADGDWHVAALISEDTDLNAWHDDGNGNLSYWAPEVGRLFLWQEQSSVLYEYVSGESTKRYVARWALKPVMVLSVVDAANEPRARVVDRSLMLGYNEEQSEQSEPIWHPSPSLCARHARVYRMKNHWCVEALDGSTWLNGQRLQPGCPVPLRLGSLLRLAELELLVDLPETAPTPTVAMPGSCVETVESESGQTAGVTLQRDFVPKEEPPEATPQLTGTQKAKELNRALRRLVLGANGVANAAARHAEAQREERYEDRAAKRRRQHPVEWPRERPVALPALPALPEAPGSIGPILKPRRFREAPSEASEVEA